MNRWLSNAVMDGYLLGASGNKLFSKEYRSKSPKGKVVVVPDFGAGLSSYEHFASLLSKEFDVLVYDLGIEGSIESAVSDLEKVIFSQESKVAICAHSFGARIAASFAKKMECAGSPLNGVYMIQPCLGKECFVSKKSGSGTLSWVKKMLSIKKSPLVAQLSELSSYDCVLEKTPVGYMLSDRDEFLPRLRLYHSLFKCRFVGMDWDDSGYVGGLNHWLNLSNGGSLLKEEAGKNSAALAERISYFFLRVFEKN